MSGSIETTSVLEDVPSTAKVHKKATVTEALVAPNGDKSTVTLQHEASKDSAEDSHHDNDAEYVKGHPVIRNGNAYGPLFWLLWLTYLIRVRCIKIPNISSR